MRKYEHPNSELPPVLNVSLLVTACPQNANISMEDSHGTNKIFGEVAPSTANVIKDIIADAPALVTSASGAAKAPKNARAQTARTWHATQTEKLAQVMAAGAPPSRRRKFQTAEYS